MQPGRDCSVAYNAEFETICEKNGMVSPMAYVLPTACSSCLPSVKTLLHELLEFSTLFAVEAMLGCFWMTGATCNRCALLLDALYDATNAFGLVSITTTF